MASFIVSMEFDRDLLGKSSNFRLETLYFTSNYRFETENHARALFLIGLQLAYN